MNMTRGFTLIEVFIALLIVSIGIGGVFPLISQTMAFVSNASSQLTAAYLAQEGIEIARNIRDSTFLQIRNGAVLNWDNGLAGCTGYPSSLGCEGSYLDTSLAASQSRFLSLDGNGFFSYSGAPTTFTRTIFVDGAGDTRAINAQVTWQ